MWKPNIQQMTTPIRIKHRVVVDINGAPDIDYEPVDYINYCNWKGMGGTESTESGSLVVYDTAQLTMWYNPEINEQDLILLNDNELLSYEVVNVENVEMRNMYMIIKVRRVVSP